MLVLASPLSAQKKIERRIPLGMEGAFRIMNMVGTVVVHGWNKDTVLIRGTLGPGNQFFAGGGYTGAKMFIESTDEHDPKPTNLEIWVPARARVWIKTATAPIDVDGVDGGLDLYTVSATIDVTGNPRELNAEAIEGHPRQWITGLVEGEKRIRRRDAAWCQPRRRDFYSQWCGENRWRSVRA
jgi:hypothetical protein